MRRFVYAIMVVLLLVTACGSREDTIKSFNGVRLFTAINDDVEYSEKHFFGSDATSIADLISSECPNGVGDDFYRVSFEAKGSTLILYTDSKGMNVSCSVLKPKDQKQIIAKKQADAPENGTIVTVNGQKITATQLQQQLEALPRGTQIDANTANVVINRLINDELLRQQAQKLDVSADEVAKERTAVLSSAGLDEAQLAKQLSENGMTASQFDESIKQQAALSKLLKTKLLLDDINVSDEDTKNYYLSNPNSFLRSEQAVMRQIFISSSGKGADEMKARANLVFNDLKTIDFCKLVNDYSDDAASKEKCGVYVIPRGVINSDIEWASFNTPVNQTSVVTTDAGIYLVQTLQVIPAQVVSYNDVSDSLRSDLKNQVLQQRLSLYIALLRTDADIVSYLE